MRFLFQTDKKELFPCAIMRNTLICAIIFVICFWFSCYCYLARCLLHTFFLLYRVVNRMLAFKAQATAVNGFWKHRQQATKSIRKLLHQWLNGMNQWMEHTHSIQHPAYSAKHTMYNARWIHGWKLNLLWTEARMLEKAFNWRQLNNTFNTHCD